MTLTLATRASLGLRGRFGTDVWQAWSNLGMHDQQDWCARQEPNVCPVEMRRSLIAILHKENIKRTVQTNCCATCANPITCTP